ncbi:MAG: hypothetical protein ACK6D3_03615, partial [Planctomycetaceae bacterium]
MIDTPLNNKEKNQLDEALGGQISEPPFLFTTIIQTMKQTDLIATPRPLLSRSLSGVFTACLAATIFLVLGYFIGVAKPVQS